MKSFLFSRLESLKFCLENLLKALDDFSKGLDDFSEGLNSLDIGLKPGSLRFWKVRDQALRAVNLPLTGNVNVVFIGLKILLFSWRKTDFGW